MCWGRNPEGGEQHDVHAAIDNFLIGINPHEHAFLHTVADFAGMIFLDALEAGLRFILKGFTDGVEFDVGIRRERLVDGTGTATRSRSSRSSAWRCWAFRR